MRTRIAAGLGVLLLSGAAAWGEEPLTFETQIVRLPGIAARFELHDGKASLGRLRIRLEDGAWVRLVDCSEGLCAEALERGRPEPRLPAGALEGSMVARGSRNIRRAWLAGAALRLGLESPVAGRLVVIDQVNGRHELDLAFDAAFLGRSVAIADADGDGEDEIVAGIGEEGRGRSLAIVELRADGLSITARTRDTDQGHDALLAGPVADLDGDGLPEITLVTDGGGLEIWRYREGRLEQAFERQGASATAEGLAAADLTGDKRADLIVPSEDLMTLQVLSVVEDEIVEAARIELQAVVATEILAVPFPGRARPVLVLGLADGTLAVVR